MPLISAMAVLRPEPFAHARATARATSSSGPRREGAGPRAARAIAARSRTGSGAPSSRRGAAAARSFIGAAVPDQAANAFPSFSCSRAQRVLDVPR